MARQSGKTLVMAHMAVFLMLTRKVRIILVAPTIGQTENLMLYVDDIITTMRLKTSKRGIRGVTLQSGGSITAMSGAPTAKVEGRPADLIIIDEKQDVDRAKIIKSFSPMIDWNDGPMWAIGVGGYVESFGERFRADYSFNCTWQRVVIDRPHYQDRIDRAKEEYAGLEEVFRANYECQPLTYTERQLLPNFNYIHKEPYGNVVVGIDLGFNDSTVVTKAYTDGKSIHLYDWLELRGVSYDTQLERIGAFVGTGSRRVIFDARSSGGGLIPWLTKMGYHPYKDTAPKKQELIKKAIVMSSNGRLTAEQNNGFRIDINKVEKRWSEAGLKATHSDYLSSLLYVIEASKDNKVGYVTERNHKRWTN